MTCHSLCLILYCATCHSVEKKMSNSQYTLHISNERIESALTDKETSSAGRFQVEIIPSLNLSSLSYLLSSDCELRLGKLEIDSYPLSFSQGETIQTFLHIPPGLAHENIYLHPDALTIKNETPLEVKTGDFLSNDPDECLNYANQLLGNSSNIYIIKRYLELVVDNDSIFNETAFADLSPEKKVSPTKDDYELLRRYCDWGIFTRMVMIEYINNLVDPALRPLKDILDIPNLRKQYRQGSISRPTEKRYINKSKVIKPYGQQTNSNRTLNTDSSDWAQEQIIDLTQLHGIDLAKYYAEIFDPANTRKIVTASTSIQGTLEESLEYAGKLAKDDNQVLLKANKEYLEQMLANNVEIITIARKLQSFIDNAEERTRLRKKSKLFRNQFLTLTLDNCKQKCVFNIEHKWATTSCSVTIKCPPIFSYKLGSQKDVDSQTYNSVTIGPITSKEIVTDIPRISNNIMSETQSLSSCLRTIARQLCVSTNILNETGRNMEKIINFSVCSEFVTFFRMNLRSEGPILNFVTLDPAQPAPEYFKIKRCYNELSSIQLILTDENNYPLRFRRNTICKIGIIFRPCPLA